MRETRDTNPIQVVHEWNTPAHRDEAEGEPERRCREDLDAGHIDSKRPEQ
ncbi:hypothetical protein [Kitasatospora sp. NPDC050463]